MAEKNEPRGIEIARAEIPDGYTGDVLEPDCDDADVGRWVVIPGFLDQDLDGVGAGEPLELCTGGADPAITDDPEEDDLVLQILD